MVRVSSVSLPAPPGQDHRKYLYAKWLYPELLSDPYFTPEKCPAAFPPATKQNTRFCSILRPSSEQGDIPHFNRPESTQRHRATERTRNKELKVFLLCLPGQSAAKPGQVSEIYCKMPLRRGGCGDRISSMLHIPRVVMSGLPDQFMQRGNRRADMFLDDDDRPRLVLLSDQHAGKNGDGKNGDEKTGTEH